MAGIIAAEGISDNSFRGILPNANILPVRVLGPCGGELSDIIDGILWSSGVSVQGAPVLGDKVDVINLSVVDFAPARAPYKKSSI